MPSPPVTARDDMQPAAGDNDANGITASRCGESSPIPSIRILGTRVLAATAPSIDIDPVGP